MKQTANTPRFSETDMMMLRAGWDPKLNEALAHKTLSPRTRITCAICETIAARLHAFADMLDAKALSLRTA